MCSYWELGLAALVGAAVVGALAMWVMNRIVIPWR